MNAPENERRAVALMVLSSEMRHWLAQERLPELDSTELREAANLNSRQLEWLDRWDLRWSAAMDADDYIPAPTPERVAAMANLIIDNLTAGHREALTMGRLDQQLAEALDRATLNAYAYIVAERPVSEVYQGARFTMWAVAALALAKSCDWAAPYHMQVVDAETKETVQERWCTMGYFTEDEQFSAAEMHAINALEPGATFVHAGASAVLRVTRQV